jgi:ATP-dependent DNA helicase RecG
MLTAEKLLELIGTLESDRIERTISFEEKKLGPAICALSNDYPNSKKPGYILLGVGDKGEIAGLKIGDDKLRNIGAIRSDGNILPQPAIIVSEVYNFPDGDVVFIEVEPAMYPPVRYKGQCWIRVGPRKAIANETEEHRLIEKRISSARSFDLRPCIESNVDSLETGLFLNCYLPNAVNKDTLLANNRSLDHQLSGLRLYDYLHNCPTHAGILLLGKDPLYFLPGAYIQYLKFDDIKMTPEPIDVRFSGPLVAILMNLDGFIRTNIVKSKSLRGVSMQEDYTENYPFWALRELVMNAIMHRNYESNAPIYIYEFEDRIEIKNPGGLYGEVSLENFPNQSDYRNPVIAEAMKILNYVNRYNFGIRYANELLTSNGNGEAIFEISKPNYFSVTINKTHKWARN